MKYALLNIIRAYWFFIPISRRRKCIFATSCSNHVFHETKSGGFRNGIGELIFRIKNCRGEFDIYTNVNGEKIMLLKTGIKVNESEIADRLK